MEVLVEKTKRDRQQNWDRGEKELLRQLVEQNIAVVEDKGNDLKMIARKKAAWEAITSGMTAGGYHRSTSKIRQQWTRMKLSAKRARIATKKAIKATGNKVSVPETDPSELLVQGMIVEQLEEDTIFIDSDSILPFPFTPTAKFSDMYLSPTAATSPVETEVNIDSPTAMVADRNATAAEPSTSTPSVPSSSRNLLGALRKLPRKPTTKCDVMSERLRQIQVETSQSKELHALRIERAKELLLQAKESTTHARDAHKLDMANKKEVHYLRIKKMKGEHNWQLKEED